MNIVMLFVTLPKKEKKNMNKKTCFTILLALGTMMASAQETLWLQCNESLPTPTRIMPVRQSDNNHQNDGAVQHSVDFTVDRNLSTNYHSAYYPEHIKVTSETPAELIYDFEGVERIDDLEYVPRQDGSLNGTVSEAEIYVKTAADSDYRLYQHCQWPLNMDTKCVHFKGGLIQPVSIKVRVLNGYGALASCAEMAFLKMGKELTDTEVFADSLYTTLKPGTTRADIERIQQPVIRQLATELLEGTYVTDYRVASYDCYDSPQWLAEQWKTPGKCYDQLQGVTGIVVEPGKHLVMVEGLPEGMSATLKVVAWYTGLTGRSFDGGNPEIKTYGLKNGSNIIDHDSRWAGLAYIAYFNDEGKASECPPIRVHFVGGTVNGYLTPDQTNEQMHQMTAAAPSRFIDVVSRKVHAVWTSAGMHEFCKADDGKSPGYRQYMNILDTLITWEQRVVGFEKYGRVPKNRTLLYVNFTYGAAFQGGLGISSHVDNERGLLNCQGLLYNDSESVWGLGHEWGHQHQLKPYFCWGGTNEVTNNLAAYYVLMHLGYRYEQLHWGKREGLEKGVKHYIESETDDCILESSDLFERLCPFVKLCNYFMNEGGKPDFLPDLYETLRHSQVTPDSTNVIPYVFNFIRTASTLSGYNLTPYFERFGFLRVKAFEIDDYGKYTYHLTQERLDAFRRDMNTLERKKKLKPMPADMVERIAHTPDIEYEHPHFEN